MIFISRVLAYLLIIFYSNELLSQSVLESKFIIQVSQKRLQQNVRELVKCGHRLGGTISGERAAKLVIEKFKNYGYKPETIVDPEKLTYTYNNWQIKILEPNRLHGLIKREWLANYSPSAELNTAQLIFLDATEDIDEDLIQGKIVLLENPADEELYAELSNAGACCIINYTAKNSASYSDWAMITNLKATDKNKIPVFNISNYAGAILKEELQKKVTIIIQYSTSTTIRSGNPLTVVASLEGRSDDYYIVCAHGDSDSGGPGADDNASGVAGVLEVARLMKSLIDRDKSIIPKYSIKFIVWGSEYFSTENYVKKNSMHLDKIKAVINFDEIGFGKTRDCLYFEGNDIKHNRELLRLFEKIGEEYVDKKGFWCEATTTPSQGGTDAIVFLPRYLNQLDLPSVKIPSITIFTTAWNEPRTLLQSRGWLSKAWKGHPDSVSIDYSPYYHSSLDFPALTTDKEPANMVWGVKAVGIALIRLILQKE